MAKSPSKSKTKVPKKYTSGLSKKEKEEREAQIRKRAKASQNGAPSYKPMVGDDKAKTKPSKYTQQAKKSGLKKKIEENKRKTLQYNNGEKERTKREKERRTEEREKDLREKRTEEKGGRARRTDGG